MKSFRFENSPKRHNQMVRGLLLLKLKYVSALIDQKNGKLIKFINEFNRED